MARVKSETDNRDPQEIEDEEREQGKQPGEGEGEDEIAVVEVDERGQEVAEIEDERPGGQPLGEDERLGDGGQPEGDGRPVSRREQRRLRRQRQRQARSRDRQEIEQLRAANEEMGGWLQALEGNLGSVSIATIDGRMNEQAQFYQQAETQLAEAAQKGDGPAMVLALRKRDEASGQWQGLATQRQQLVEAGQGRPRQQQQRRISRQVMRRIENFCDDTCSWYDYKNPFENQDTRIVHAIDGQVAADGYTPDTDDYWEELEDRVREALPHRFEDERSGERREEPRPRTRPNGQQRPARRGPPTGGGDRERPLAANEVLLTPERKKAMMDAGIWDNPDRRRKQLLAYKKYDLEHGPPGRAN
jgi:hypothetical protein